MNGATKYQHDGIWMLTAQAAALGTAAAVLGIVANTMFLDEYGSQWLPVTYVFIAVAGIVTSALVTRSARGGKLSRTATIGVAGSVVVLVLAWLVAAGAEGAWVSGPLLVLFPVLIQLGFVIIGSQCGGILDTASIRAHFMRIFAGFPIGAIVGGVVSSALLIVDVAVEHLILVVAVAQLSFLCLVLLTARSHAPALEPKAVASRADESERRPLARLLHDRFVLLIVAYQVLSAIGSQLADFLVFDRAAAQYPGGQDLAHFLARYTVIMNIASLLFLTLLAGALLRRFGLRLGLPANPAIVAGLAVGMIIVSAVAGVGSFALLMAVSAARIADVALTDGTTRASISSTYQVLPDDDQLAVQARVDAFGVPIAIGVSGIVLLLLDALPASVQAAILATTVVCVIWTWVAILLYREYGAALVGALRRRPVLDPEWAIECSDPEEAAATALLASGDERVVQLGLELLAAMASPALTAELERLVDDPRPEIRLAVRVRLAAAGDSSACRKLRQQAVADAASADPADRIRAAHALTVLGEQDRAASVELLFDLDPQVRSAAIEAVRFDDIHAIEHVIEALEDRRTSGVAASAIERLGPCIAPALAHALDAVGCPATPFASRVVRAAGNAAPELAQAMLGGYIGHQDRDLGLVVLESVATASPAPQPLASELDRVLLDDACHASRIVRAMSACSDVAPVGSVLHRALTDEFDLVRSRVVAGRLVRHGRDRLGAHVLALSSDERRRRLAVTALDVTLHRSEAALALPVLREDLSPEDRVALLPVPATELPADVGEWLADLIADARGEWRSPWLRACALHTAMNAPLGLPLDSDQLRALDEPLIRELMVS